MASEDNRVSTWLSGLGIYLIAMAVGNLAWEAAHLPLYTIWRDSSGWEQAYAVVHCTIGDVLIASSTFMLAYLAIGHRSWPQLRFWPVAILATAGGVVYTIYSEWNNVYVRASWAYSDLMPIVRLGDLPIGLSPILQWIVLPAAAFALVRRWAAIERRPA